MNTMPAAGMMGGMDIRREYRGWTIGIGTAERSRRKPMGHAARKEPPRLLVMASGWGVELVDADLCRQIDQAEAKLAGDAATSPE